MIAVDELKNNLDGATACAALLTVLGFRVWINWDEENSCLVAVSKEWDSHKHSPFDVLLPNLAEAAGALSCGCFTPCDPGPRVHAAINEVTDRDADVPEAIRAFEAGARVVAEDLLPKLEPAMEVMAALLEEKGNGEVTESEMRVVAKRCGHANEAALALINDPAWRQKVIARMTDAMG